MLFEFDGRPTSLDGFDLAYCELQDLDLSSLPLRGTVLTGSHLSRTNLRGADLSNANLRGAILSEANLSDSCLRGADFTGASLYGTNFSNSNVGEAILSSATYDNSTIWPENFHPPTDATNIDEKFSLMVAQRVREKAEFPSSQMHEPEFDGIRIAIESFVRQVSERCLTDVNHGLLSAPWLSAMEDVGICRYSPYADQSWYCIFFVRSIQINDGDGVRRIPYSELDCMRGWNSCVLASNDDTVEKVFLVLKSGEVLELHTAISGGYRHDAWFVFDLMRSIAQHYAGAASMRSE